jgi:hypothetical protein
MLEWRRCPGESPDAPCEVCGQPDCDCPECPECGVAGDPACYLPGSHGLVRTQAQVTSLRRALEQADADREVDAAQSIGDECWTCECWTCDGDGKDPDFVPSDSPESEDWPPCPACDGAGVFRDDFVRAVVFRPPPPR